jgi:hypothetical protein
MFALVYMFLCECMRAPLCACAHALSELSYGICDRRTVSLQTWWKSVCVCTSASGDEFSLNLLKHVCINHILITLQYTYRTGHANRATLH